MILVAVGLVVAFPGLAQESASSEARSEIMEALEALPNNAASVESIQSWKAVGNALGGQDVKSILTGEGWSEMAVEEAITAQTYDLYVMTVGPGTKAYMVIPQAEGGVPVQFSGGVPDKALVEALPASRTDPEEIRKQILIQLTAAIEALCAMEARPTTIRAGASAFGVISVEGTWEAEEVCGR